MHFIVSVKKQKIAIHVWGSKISFLANLHFCLASKIDFLEYPMMYLNIDDEILKENIQINGDFIYPPKEPGLGIYISSKTKALHDGGHGLRRKFIFEKRHP